jgi:GcrA cell cycle regulator
VVQASIAMWNSESIEVLKKLWSHGQSAGQIAEQLNCSRSAVCAKLQRLGLRRAHKPPTSKPMILPARSVKSSDAKRSRPLRRPQKQAKREEYSQRELHEMLAQAVKNTG